MSSYSRYDFAETCGALAKDEKPVYVLAAWGAQGDYSEWTGGFFLQTSAGRYAYVWGWCDTTGWGCQDGVYVKYYEGVPAVEQLVADHKTEWPQEYNAPPSHERWDLEPSDLNKWIADGMRSPYD